MPDVNCGIGRRDEGPGSEEVSTVIGVRACACAIDDADDDDDGSGPFVPYHGVESTEQAVGESRRSNSFIGKLSGEKTGGSLMELTGDAADCGVPALETLILPISERGLITGRRAGLVDASGESIEEFILAIDAGDSSAPRSRLLLVGIGLFCGSGKSPKEASSRRISLFQKRSIKGSSAKNNQSIKKLTQVAQQSAI